MEQATRETCALDIETTRLHPWEPGARVRCLQLRFGTEPPMLYEWGNIPPSLKERIRASTVVIHNAAFECTWLPWLRDTPHLFCTWRAAEVLASGLDMPTGLWDLQESLLGWERPAWLTDAQKSDWDVPSLSQDQVRYALSDVGYLTTLMENLTPRLISAGLMETAQLEFNCARYEGSISAHGLMLDVDAWERLGSLHYAESLALSAEILPILGEIPNPEYKPPTPRTRKVRPTHIPVNLSSPMQLLRGLANLGLDLQGTSEEVLTRASDQHPVISKILRHRFCTGMQSKFGKHFMDQFLALDRRIHPSYYPMLETGRFSCSKPNMQQIPRTRSFRDCFIAGPGNVLIACDYDGEEMRIATFLAREDRLAKIFREGGDAHAHTARAIAGERYTSSDRQAAKAVNFGLLFGMGVKRLHAHGIDSYGLKWSMQEAARAHATWHALYPSFRAWHTSAKSAFDVLGHTRTLSGRRRILPQGAYSDVFNSPVQGTGADILKIALYEACRAGLPVAHHAHDEILIEVPERNAQEAGQALLQIMRNAGESLIDPSYVPITASGGVGASWGHAKSKDAGKIK